VTGGTVTTGEAGALETVSAAGTAEGDVVEALAVQAERRATASIPATTDLIGDPRIVCNRPALAGAPSLLERCCPHPSGLWGHHGGRTFSGYRRP
jgi:hypothetical protein